MTMNAIAAVIKESDSDNDRCTDWCVYYDYCTANSAADGALGN